MTHLKSILTAILLGAVVALPATLAWDIAAGTSVQASAGPQCNVAQALPSASAGEAALTLASLVGED